MEAPLRTSSYLIPVKLESEPDKYMLIHGHTGAIDIATESLLKKIQSVASGTDLLSEMIDVLLKRGYITTKTQEEEYAYVARMATALYRKAEILNTSFTWVITYNCNFRCPYCFEGRNAKDGQKQIVFTEEIANRAYQVMEQIQPHKELRRNMITLFGGEPLLAENKEILSYIVEEGVKRGYKFAAVTNGYDLDAYFDLLSPEKICKLQVTIDGMKELHNARRVHYKYYDTFDKIIANLRLSLEKGVAVSVRMNVDNRNMDDFLQLKRYFESNGFYQYSGFSFYSAYLRNNTSIDDSEQENLEFLSKKDYLEKNKRQGILSMCQSHGVLQMIHNAIENGKPISFRSAFCGAQVGGYVIDPIGRIYPCWEVIGQKEYQIASYNKRGVHWNKAILSEWRKSKILNQTACRTCKYALICGGGCLYHSQVGNKGHCYYFQKMFDFIVNHALVQKAKAIV